MNDLLHQRTRARVLVSRRRRSVFLAAPRHRGFPPPLRALPRVPGRLRRFPSELHGRFTLRSVRSFARASTLRWWLSPSFPRCFSPSTGAGAQAFSRATTTSADFPRRARARRPFRREVGSPRVRDTGLPSAAARSTNGPLGPRELRVVPLARPSAVGLSSGFCASARWFATGFLQTVRCLAALALRFGSSRSILSRGLAPRPMLMSGARGDRPFGAHSGASRRARRGGFQGREMGGLRVDSEAAPSPPVRAAHAPS